MVCGRAQTAERGIRMNRQKSAFGICYWFYTVAAFLLAVLRLIGLEAEEAMYEATGHINTHKGLIFSLGLVLGAAGEVSAARSIR